ncbi:transcription-repair coupling factor [Geopsychrobacter electrodiphilus]|uniref:transcription-repair coupling factor n=1 Tax=Geopsychrobacter electrodiphilus TaxID=225196 RepID=UPI00037100A8|nr:transcription-repair coupling factor [Geopsychrobacter electrodiphilus]
MDQELSQHINYATAQSLLDGFTDRHRQLEILGINGSSDAALLSKTLGRNSRPLFVVCSSQKEAQRLCTDLQFFAPRAERIALFPHWELGPYDPLTPHPEIEASRLDSLVRLLKGEIDALIVPARALMQRVIPRPILASLSLVLKLEDEYPRQELLQQLQNLGYQPVALVEDRGSFAVRGDIIDIFPADAQQPVRLDFYGDYIERMRTFDPTSQRSEPGELKQLRLIPSRELCLSGEHLEHLLLKLKQRCDELELPRNLRDGISEELKEGILAPGRAFLLPFNYPGLESLFDYLPEADLIFNDPPAIEQEIDLFSGEIRAAEKRQLEHRLPHVKRQTLYLDPSELEQAFGRYRRIELSRLQVFQLDDQRQSYHFDINGNSDLRASLAPGQDGLAPLLERLEGWSEEDWRILLVCRQSGQAQRLQGLLRENGWELPLRQQTELSRLPAGAPQLQVGELSAGFRMPYDRLVIITEEEIFGQRSHHRKKTRKSALQLFSSLADLREQDFIVHTDHGVGRYLGLIHLTTGGSEGDYLHLEYAGADKLYLPVERIEKVQKYIGGEGAQPRLDKMGGQGWEKARLKARAAIEELARQLLEIYARRELCEGFAFSPPDRLFREFEATFPYEETSDQAAAIIDALTDMCSPKPMDRLICGDVGYGKTEVALRAATKAVLDGKQVAVLVPTTVLAQQHWKSFSERLKDFPVQVEMISRFRTPAEIKKVLEGMASGRVDIVIGTHRLLQRDIRFKDLGLLVIDEEQRFGVSHKEKLKSLRAEVDTLTLTATPIPRTLHMSMAGMRDLSVIETPPIDRLAIRTYVTRFDDELIREAILRELRRGGQVYFVHNRVQTIGAMAEHLQQLVPEAKIAVGHGQMPEKELERVMLDFIEGRSNLLVASTIIENGLDIPIANTIIINRADCFGLSQLYQLRGRVGRSDRRAYAYLLIPGEASLTREARERLKVLQELTELGSGFRIASHDLELRGAGDLLGAKQSGPIAAIGFELYTELLEETIEKLRGHECEARIDPEIRLGLSAFLPEKYLPDPNQRLQFYQKLAGAEDDREIFDIADELQDRYGALPPPGELLLGVMRLRIILKELCVELLEYDGRRLNLRFHASTRVSPDLIRSLLDQEPERFSLSADFRLSIRCERWQGEELLRETRRELQRFQGVAHVEA